MAAVKETCTIAAPGDAILAESGPTSAAWELVFLPGVASMLPGLWFNDLIIHHRFGAIGYVAAAAAIAVPWTLVCALCLVRRRLVLSVRGIRWRGLGRWREATWDQVTDFYRCAGREGKGAVIQTTAGRIRLWDREWREDERVRQIIAERAEATGCGEWNWRGLRDRDRGLREFRYPGSTVYWLLAAVGCAAATIYWMASLHSGTSWPSYASMRDTVSGRVYVDLAKSLQGVLVGYLCARVNWTWLSQRHERVLVSHEGIALDGRQPVEAKWSEVTGYEARSGASFEIRTVQGKIVFSRYLQAASELKEIVSERAPAGVGAWDMSMNAPLPGRVPDVPAGVRVHHYRTSSVWTVLFAGSAGVLILFIAAGCVCTGLFTDGIPANSLLCGALVLATAAALVRLARGYHAYRRSAVWWDETGITQRTLRWTRTIPWLCVQRWTPTDDIHIDGVVEGQPVQLRISSEISDAAVLRAAIAARARNAPQWIASGDGAADPAAANSGREVTLQGSGVSVRL